MNKNEIIEKLSELQVADILHIHKGIRIRAMVSLPNSDTPTFLGIPHEKKSKAPDVVYLYNHDARRCESFKSAKIDEIRPLTVSSRRV